MPGTDRAVRGKAFTGFDDHGVADHEVGGGHEEFTATASHGGGVRHEREQCPQASAGPGNGVFLESFADREQKSEHGRLADFPEHDRPDRGDGHQGADPDLASG